MCAVAVQRLKSVSERFFYCIVGSWAGIVLVLGIAKWNHYGNHYSHHHTDHPHDHCYMHPSLNVLFVNRLLGRSSVRFLESPLRSQQQRGENRQFFAGKWSSRCFSFCFSWGSMSLGMYPYLNPYPYPGKVFISKHPKFSLHIVRKWAQCNVANILNPPKNPS